VLVISPAFNLYFYFVYVFVCLWHCQGTVIDVKFSSKKIWILKENALLEWDLQNAIVNA